MAIIGLDLRDLVPTLCQHVGDTGGADPATARLIGKSWRGNDRGDRESGESEVTHGCPSKVEPTLRACGQVRSRAVKRWRFLTTEQVGISSEAPSTSKHSWERYRSLA